MKTNLSIAYIDFGDRFDPNGTSGIERKKLSQIHELEKIGDVKRLAFYPKRKKSLLGNISRTLPFFPSTFFFTYDEKQLAGLDVVYFRKPAYIDRYTIKLLKDIKKQSPRCLILFEIPTYPYDKEKIGLGKYPLLLKDRWNRRKLQRFVDRIIVVASDEPVIFSIPAIKILNGIDFLKTSLRKISFSTDDSIHAIFVGNFEHWHGLDRIVEGMKRYYNNSSNNRSVILHVVGPTENAFVIDSETERLISNGNIHFYGSLPYSEVEKVYDKVSLACEAFGVHRRSPGQLSSSIKSREYGAKGLPIISESKIDYIPLNYPYFLKVSEDESPIDIESIIKFHDDVYSVEVQSVAAEIRNFAESRCSSEAMMKPVLEFCKSMFSNFKTNPQEVR